METREIQLTKGFVVIVDAADYDWLNQWNWFAKVGGRGGNPYAARSVHDPITKKVSTIRMHRFIVDAPEALVVDHIDRNTMNNCRDNLRVVTQKVNLENRVWNKSAKKNIMEYVYTDNRTNTFVFMCFALDILEADDLFGIEIGQKPINLSYMGCTINMIEKDTPF